MFNICANTFCGAYNFVNLMLINSIFDFILYDIFCGGNHLSLGLCLLGPHTCSCL